MLYTSFECIFVLMTCMELSDTEESVHDEQQTTRFSASAREENSRADDTFEHALDTLMAFDDIHAAIRSS